MKASFTLNCLPCLTRLSPLLFEFRGETLEVICRKRGMGKIMCSEIDMSPPRETQNKVWASWQMLPEVLSRCALGHLWAWMMPEAPSCPGKEGEQASEELPEKSHSQP